MKILIITRYFPLEGFPFLIGGISFSLKSLFDTFKKKGHKISVFVYPENKKVKMNFPRGIHNVMDYKRYVGKNLIPILKNILSGFKIFKEVHSFSNKLKDSFYYLKNFRNLINMFNCFQIIKHYDYLYNFDVVLAYDSTIPSQIGGFIKKERKKKLVIISHGNDVINRNYNLFTIKALKTADNIIVRSNFVKNLIMKLYKINENKIFICPDGVIVNNIKIDDDKLKLREELRLSTDSFIILTIGTLYNVRKGFDLVLKAIKELRDRYKIDLSTIKYLLIGRDNPEVRNWLYSLARKYNLSKNFKILINVNENIRNKYYKASDLFVMPSRDLKDKGSIEGFGNVFIEAGYHFLPTIGSNTGGIPDAIVNEKSGYLINNFDELVEKIKLLYENEELRLIMGNYAHQRVLKKFTWEIIYKKYLKVFNI